MTISIPVIFLSLTSLLSPPPSFSIITLRKSYYHRYSISLALHIKILGYVAAPSFTPLGMRPLCWEYMLRAITPVSSPGPKDPSSHAMPPSQARVCLYSALIVSQGLLTQGICLHMTDSRKRKTGEKVKWNFIIRP